MNGGGGQRKQSEPSAIKESESEERHTERSLDSSVKVELKER